MRMTAPALRFAMGSLTCVIVTTLLADPTWAVTASGRASEERRMSVPVADLDLNSDAGRTTALARINQAAARLCLKVVDSRSIDFHNALRECSEESSRTAAQQLKLEPAKTAAR